MSYGLGLSKCISAISVIISIHGRVCFFFCSQPQCPQLPRWFESPLPPFVITILLKTDDLTHLGNGLRSIPQNGRTAISIAKCIVGVEASNTFAFACPGRYHAHWPCAHNSRPRTSEKVRPLLLRSQSVILHRLIASGGTHES